MEYTREAFTRLLEKHFSAILFNNGRYYIENHDNKTVAEALDYSEKQFGNCLNPSDNTSYKTVINRLLKYDRMKALEKQVAVFQKRNNDLEKWRNRNTQLIKWSIIGAITLTIFSTYWLSDKFSLGKSMEEDLTEIQAQNFVIKDRVTFDRILKHHGELMVYRLFYEGVRINEMVQNVHEHDLDSVLNVVAASYITTATIDGRKYLQNIGFVNSEGINMVDFLNEEYPTGSLFAAKSSPFSSALEKVKSHLINPDVNYDTLLKEIENSSNETRSEQWNKVWEEGWEKIRN